MQEAGGQTEVRPRTSEFDPPTTENSVDDGLPSVSPRPYMHGLKLGLILWSFSFSVLIVALDTTIVATALPHIVSSFEELKDITWVPTAYLLTQGSFILSAGKLLTIFPAKHVLLVAVGLFELGSLICGVAPSMNALIAGRAISGCGAAGIISSVLVSVAQVASLEMRPIFFGIVGAVFGLSSVLGPLIGGALTERVTWRWCFYINLPIGGLALVALIFFLETLPPIGQGESQEHQLISKRLIRLDWVGTVLCLGAVISFVLAMQMGGNVRPWSSAPIIALLCVFGVLLTILILWETRTSPEYALVPRTVVGRRSEVGAAFEGFFNQMTLYIGGYYIPLWYQASKQRNPLQSGIDTLPFMLSIVVCALFTGGLVSTTGRYWPFMFGMPIISVIGAGLLFTADVNTSTARMIGYQILFGVGIGGCMQNVDVAVQAEFADDEKLIPQAATVATFMELMGGTTGLAIAGAIFQNALHRDLASNNSISSAQIAAVEASVTAIASLPPSLQAVVTEIYVQSISPVLIIGVPAMALAILSSLLIKNHDLKTRGVKPLGDLEDLDDSQEKSKT